MTCGFPSIRSGQRDQTLCIESVDRLLCSRSNHGYVNNSSSISSQYIPLILIHCTISRHLEGLLLMWNCALLLTPCSSQCCQLPNRCDSSGRYRYFQLCVVSGHHQLTAWHAVAAVLAMRQPLCWTSQWLWEMYTLMAIYKVYNKQTLTLKKET